MAAPPSSLRDALDDRERRAVRAVVALAGARGIDTAGVGVLRTGTSVLVGLPGPCVLARVDGPALAGRAERQVRVADLLDRLGVPAVRPVVDRVLTSPVDPASPGGADAVTLWRWERTAGREARPEEVGALAGHLHRATSGRPELAALPAAEPLGAVADQLRAHVADDPDARVLLEVAEGLEATWAEVAAAAPPVVVHADLHAGNVVVTDHGPVLADLELSGVGPAAYDVAPQVVAVRRYGRPPGDLDAFLDGYGEGAPDPATVDALVPVYELWATAWSVANRGLDADHEAEARLRAARWASPGPDADARRWTLR